MVNELLGAILFGAALAFLIDSLLERLRGDATNAIVVCLCTPPPPSRPFSMHFLSLRPNLFRLSFSLLPWPALLSRSARWRGTGASGGGRGAG